MWEEALGELNILLKCTLASLQHCTGCSAQCRGDGLLLGALAPQKCIEAPPGGSSSWPQGAASCPLLPAAAPLAPPRHGPWVAQHRLPGGAGASQLIGVPQRAVKAPGHRTVPEAASPTAGRPHTCHAASPALRQPPLINHRLGLPAAYLLL